MLAPLPKAYRVEWCSLGALGDLAAEWRELDSRALEPNVFYGPQFMSAAAAAFGQGAGVTLVRSISGRLTGLFPARIERWRGRSDPPLGYWAIEVADGSALHGRPIGSVLLVPLPNGDGEVEIGWHLHPDAWGRGYASEAALAVLRHGFAGGLEEIHAVTHLTNGPSQAVCRRIGMEHRGVTHLWYEEPSEHFVATRG